MMKSKKKKKEKKNRKNKFKFNKIFLHVYLNSFIFFPLLHDENRTKK